MRIGVNTFPPECHKCGVVDSPDVGQPVERYADNDADPHWPDWLCADCRTEQWHLSDSGLSLREFLGQSELEHKFWVEGKWDEFMDAREGEE